MSYELKGGLVALSNAVAGAYSTIVKVIGISSRERVRHPT